MQMSDDTGPAPSSALSEQYITLLNSVHGRLLGFLLVMLGNRADAEDVLQRTSLTLWRKFGDFAAGTDFFAWASSVAFYEAKNFQRMALRSRLHFDDALLDRFAEERNDDLQHREQRLAALEKCIEEVEPAGRDLVREFYLKNVDLGELSERLGRAPQTLYNKLNTIRRLLADCVTRKTAREA
jgi:RNA polymerase sigma-70 factor (ECF subfamily)